MHPQQPWTPVAAMVALVVAMMLATTTVIVEPGDTLSVLAQRHDVTVADLVEWNDLDDPDRIIAGTTLIVAPPESPGDAPPTGAVYVVTAGDTLSSIARRFGATVAALADANEITDVNRIFEGQTLQVGGSGPGAAAAPTPAPTEEAPSTSYVVQPGDTLWSIAHRHGLSIAQLAARNDIDDVDRIREGTTLQIGAPAPPPSTSPPPPAPEGDGASRDADEVLLTPRFAHWSDVYRVPQDLLEAIAWKESNWNPDAVGPTGALGLMQLRPETIEFIVGGLLGRDLDPLDADDSIQMGARFLRYLLDRTNGEQEAVAAWQQGLASVQRDGVTAEGAAYATSIEEIRQLRG